MTKEKGSRVVFLAVYSDFTRNDDSAALRAGIISVENQEDRAFISVKDLEIDCVIRAHGMGYVPHV